MKKFFSFFVLLMTVSAVMADNSYQNLYSGYAEQGIDKSDSTKGYYVNFYAENYILKFEIAGATKIQDMKQYALTDMIADSTYLVEIGATQYDIKQIKSCELIKSQARYFAKMITNSNDTINIDYVSPDSTVQLLMNNDTNTIIDYIATDSVFQIVAADDPHEYTLSIAFKGVSQIDGMYFNKDVFVYDSATQKTYTRMIHRTEGRQDTIAYNVLAPFAFIQSTSDSTAMCVVNFRGDDNIIYGIIVNAKIYRPTTAVENVVASEYQAYAEGHTIVLAGAEGELATVYDMTGRVVCSKSVGSDIERIEVGADGVYFVRVKGETMRVVVK